MPETLQGLFVVAVGLLPGALYVWSFEQIVGRWGIGLADRVLRFVGISALFHALLLPATYRLWFSYVRTGRLQAGDVPIVLWLVAIAYVGTPVFAGRVVAKSMRERSRLAMLVTGPAPAPRAWDYFFSTQPVGWMRLRLKSGAWLGGLFDAADERQSYAAGYPENGDIYLSRSIEIDAETGEIAFDEEGQPVLRESSLMVRWEEVHYMEFTEG